jgi:hypothetical protein
MRCGAGKTTDARVAMVDSGPSRGVSTRVVVVVETTCLRADA